MTDDAPGPAAEGERSTRREARLRELLSVDIGAVGPRRRGDDAPPTPAGEDAPTNDAPHVAVPPVDVPQAEGPPADAPQDEVPPVDAPAEVTPPDGGDHVDAVVSPAPADVRTRTRFQRAVSIAVLCTLFVAGGTLVWAGATIIRSSTQGEVIEPVRDPDSPGYEAIVDPTPTLALLHDTGGVIDGITVLTLPEPGAGGGGVVLVPTRVVVEIPILGVTPIEAGYDLGSPSVQAEAVGDLLGASMGEVAVVDDERWAGLVEPVAPLVIDNPDALVVDDEVRFPAGEVLLEPDDVGPYLEARVPGESDLARLYRHELLWRSWLAAVADADAPDAVPGELSSGIGRFVRTLADGAVVVETLPVTDSTTERFGDEPTFRPEPVAIADLVTRLVPFPRSPRPGVRPLVRVLNGTSDTTEAADIAHLLPPAGVEVVIIGNSSSLDHEQTTVAYVDAQQRRAAEAIVDILGAGVVLQDPRPSDVVDITVTLGSDHD